MSTPKVLLDYVIIARSTIQNGTARTGQYIPVRQQTSTRIARYRAVPSIGAVSTPISIVVARYRAVSTEGEGRRGRKRGRKKDLEF
ncbi:hypothetical protein B296_00052280 [Ensete ventricosum]|uniref:Uncharacterized protein n=1 Tax=Ensete ventricosum TaxID=4639 RepID=A0A426YD09_ENSVE|nr:hypothetical protein B296_00052280 [Ensete ventricosum]